MPACFAWLASFGHFDVITAVERTQLAIVIGMEALGVGLGTVAFVAYIARTTAEGDSARIALGIAVLCLYVLAFNRLLWRRLYDIAAERLRLD